ncbi:MAG: FG-GAP-like repeat-containing protein [Bacteroidota bacterium]
MRYVFFGIRLAFCLLSFVLVGQDPQFVDVSDQAGTGNGSSNNGAVIGDFNGDGWEDIFVPARLDSSRIFLNNSDGTFSDVSSDAGIQQEGLTMTAAWGDIDNDGDLDLFVGNYYTAGSPFQNYLYLNDGSGQFSDISLSAGVGTNDQTRSVHLLDVDLDGYLDIYVCNLAQQNILWHNNGDLTFSDHTISSGLLDTQISMGAIFFDYDNDGDQDIYLTHDANQAYIMYENDGTGVFTDVSQVTGLDVAGQGMGVDHGDINNDGHLDIYVTNLGPNFLLLNDGNGSYSEIAMAAGVADVGMGWGCFFLDYDNDGWEDIYVINDSNFSPVSNKLYKNNGDNTFTLVSESSPLFSFNGGIGGTWADINNDGFQDIIVANGENDIGLQIFENQNNQNNWIGFNLNGTMGSSDAFGTRIQITTETGVKIDEKTGGSSYASQSSHRIYFGLGEGIAEDISIFWPNGTVDFFESMDINQIHSLNEGQSPVGLDEINFDLSLYHNPFVDELRIHSSLNRGTLEIFDLLGKRIFFGNIESSLHVFDLSHLDVRGQFILRISDLEGNVTSESVIKR